MEAIALPLSRPRPEKAALPLVIAGLSTSGLSLFAVSLIEFNLMGWYLWYVIPLGALIVGLCAGSGYGVASWVTGVKISKGLLWAVLGVQVLVYFTAQYVVFRDLVAQLGIAELGFIEYFDVSTRSIAFKQKSGGVGDALGMFGYVFRVLEIAGFAAGGLIVPAWAKGKPYCESCQVYMRTSHLGRLPAGTEPRKVKKGEAGAEAFEQAHRGGFEAGIGMLQRVQACAREGAVQAFRDELAPHLPQNGAYNKLTSRIELHLVSCPRCFDGWLSAAVVSGQGDQIVTEHLPSARAAPEFIRALR
jgi:hypothetical protein